MGIPKTAQYIIAAHDRRAGPVAVGNPSLVSHMFVFYFAILADVTPPVALAAYAASGISGGDPFRTGLRAFTLDIGRVHHPLCFRDGADRSLDADDSGRDDAFDYVWFGQVLLTYSWAVVALRDGHRVSDGTLNGSGTKRLRGRGRIPDHPRDPDGYRGDRAPRGRLQHADA
jgi:hypothetical protein